MPLASVAADQLSVTWDCVTPLDAKPLGVLGGVVSGVGGNAFVWVVAVFPFAPSFPALSTALMRNEYVVAGVRPVIVVLVVVTFLTFTEPCHTR